MSLLQTVKSAVRDIERGVRATGHRRKIDHFRSTGLYRNVWLTYDPDGHTDGAGAQFHRILAIYALARALGANYFHSPIRRLDYVGLPVAGRLAAADVIRYFDSLTNIGTDPTWPGIGQVQAIDLPRFSLLELTPPPDRPTLYRIVNPHVEMDLNPSFWPLLGPILKSPKRSGSAKRVALHVRRGDLHHYTRERMLPNSYYIALARRLVAAMGSEAHLLSFELYSESLAAGTTIAQSEFTPGALDHDVLIDRDLDDFAAFDELPNLTRFINLNVAETTERLLTADVLVMSKSSLSMVAGLLNPDRPVLYPRFWHAPMESWIRSARRDAADAAAGMLLGSGRRA